MQGRKLTAAALALLVVPACEHGQTMLAPDLGDFAPAFIIVPNVGVGEVIVCKDAPSGAAFSITLSNISNFTVNVSNPVTVFGGDCVSVGVTSLGIGSVTLTENPTAGFAPQKVEVYEFISDINNQSGAPTLKSTSTTLPLSATVGPNNDVGYVVVFYNVEEPPPPPPDGCTATLGFWKTHPDAWPASHDPDAAFFTGSASWLQTLWTPPVRGNAYFILAHQYIAAVLNAANGASVPADVQAAIDGATTFFTSAPYGVAPTGATRAQLLGWAELLDGYNNGNEGVDHCG